VGKKAGGSTASSSSKRRFGGKRLTLSGAGPKKDYQILHRRKWERKNQYRTAARKGVAVFEAKEKGKSSLRGPKNHLQGQEKQKKEGARPKRRHCNLACQRGETEKRRISSPKKSGGYLALGQPG